MVLELLSESLKVTVLFGLAIAGMLVILIWKKNRTKNITYIKFIVQTVSFVAIFYIFTYPYKPLLILVVILTTTFVLGRFFCGWICPFGLYMDIHTLIRRVLKLSYINLPEKLNKFLHNIRYLLLGLFFSVTIILTIIEPLPSLNSLTLLAMVFAGPFEYLGILVGPIVPLIVPWEGPLEIGGLYFSFPYVQEVIKYSGENFATVMALIFLLLIVISSFLVRRGWCRFCPTGISLAIVNRFKGFNWAPILHINKNETKCTKCGICKRVCPVQVNEVYEKKGGKIKTSMCMLCFRCVEMCPFEDCLKVNFGKKSVFKSRNWLETSEEN